MFSYPGVFIENQISGTGVSDRASVRAATTSNVVINTDLVNGGTIDGITLSTGDRVLVKNQESLPEITNVSTVASVSGSLGGKYFTLSSPTTNYYVWYNTGGSTDPSPGGTGIAVSILSNETATVVASKTQIAADAQGDFSAVVVASMVTITNASTGVATDSADVDTGFTISVLQQGVSTWPEITDVTTVADSAGSLSGKYFLIYSTTTNYYVWLDVDNGSSDPSPGGTGIEVDITTNDAANTVASKIQAKLDLETDFSASVLTNVVTITNSTDGPVDDFVDVNTGFTINATQKGTGSVDNLVWEIQASGGPLLTTDFDKGESIGGSKITVREGNLGEDTVWVCANSSPNDISGTDGMSWVCTTGDVSGPGFTTNNALVRWGDNKGKIAKDSLTILDDDGTMTVQANKTGYPLFVKNIKPDAGGNGLCIMAGEEVGDILLHVSDTNDTFTLMEIEAEGRIVFGQTYTDAVASEGTLYGLDIQHSAGDNADFNTKNGVYRINQVDVVDVPQTFNNKSIEDATCQFIDSADNSKRLRFQVNSVSSGTTRTLTIPDGNSTILTTTLSQTATNKTITDTSNNVTANGLRSATTTVNVSSATAPSVDQVLTATSSTAATWQSPNVFGTQYQYIESEALSTTTATTFQIKAQFTTPSLPLGTYRIDYSCEVSSSNNSAINIEVDYETIVMNSISVKSNNNNEQYRAINGFKDVNLSGVNTIRIRYSSSAATKTAMIQRARISLIRTA